MKYLKKIIQILLDDPFFLFDIILFKLLYTKMNIYILQYFKKKVCYNFFFVFFLTVFIESKKNDRFF